MRKMFFLVMVIFICSCKNDEKKETATETSTAASPAADSVNAPVDLPYTATYSSRFNSDVPDADLKMVLTSYKNWADSNMTGLMGSMGDSVVFEPASGKSQKMSNADLAKRWASFRDSLSSVRIEMEAWQKMHSTDKNNNFILCWYKEYDTYKNGKVDSAYWHDINQVENGKITFYRQYKRAEK